MADAYGDQVKVMALRAYWFTTTRLRVVIPALIAAVVVVLVIVTVAYRQPAIPITPAATNKSLIKTETVDTTAFDPQAHVAIAIPVGGRTERSVQLTSILRRLIDGGALAENIFVFEDVLGRPNREPFKTVRDAADAVGVRVVPTQISRDDYETNENFGIHLARHYHAMLEHIFAADTPYEFAVVIEDDLDIAPDTTKFFFSMSNVMRADPTLYCVSAHQDNAFLGIHRNDDFDGPAPAALKEDDFDFRRGNHFMAPGWMTSRQIYTEVVRPKWLDKNGQYAYKDELHLRNGHWDRFFDSLIGTRDCIFSEIPRITHQGADGFTVSARGQMELYSNLRLSHLPQTTDYGDLSRLTQSGYIQTTNKFILSAKLLNSLEETRLYRHEHLVYIVAADHDADEEWNAIINKYFGLIGVGGYGGWNGYVKVRGIYHGAVFIRWMTNLILLIGHYSTYIQQVRLLTYDDTQQVISRVGCYIDAAKRDLPFHVDYLTDRAVTPRACLSACNHLGYRYAAVQMGAECWCGHSYGSHGVADNSQCSFTCSAVARSPLAQSKDINECGGRFANTVYENTGIGAMKRWQSAVVEPEDVRFVAADDGQSCDAACEHKSSTHRRCDERLFPLIHRSCAVLNSIFASAGGGCDMCIDEEDPERGFATPARIGNDKRCVMSRARYHRCNWLPPPQSQMKRACTCVR